MNIQSDLGTNELATSELEIYPNPLKNGQLITLKNCELNSKIIVLDANGKHVHTTNLDATSTVALPLLAEGLYTVHIECSRTIYNKKLVIVE